MKRASVVIGAGYGDEGKGLMTDYLCHKHDADMVVRFNGGAQAGHTVVEPYGQRHVFGHLGSGSFVGVPTYLSKYFVFNPILFVREKKKFTFRASMVYADQACMVTTPYDMIANQILEKSRGVNRHGSVGVGFGETIGRHELYPIHYRDMYDIRLLRQKVSYVREELFGKRLYEAGVDIGQYRQYINSDGLFEDFIRQCDTAIRHSQMVDEGILVSCHNVVFEGAQGLMLDMDRGQFPHVTRSNTGIKNAIDICKNLGCRDISATYVTRSYVTRHGAGPLRGELDSKPYDAIVDDTNIPHLFQGALRFAYLNVDVLGRAIYDDLDSADVNVNANLAVTCIDQLPTHGVMIENGERLEYLRNEFGQIVNEKIGLDGRPLFSHGPTRLTVNAG